MKKGILFFISCLLLVSLEAKKVQSTGHNLQLGFVENKGQVHDQSGRVNAQVLYMYSAKGMNVQLRANGFSYEFFKFEKGSKSFTSNRIDFDFSACNTVIKRTVSDEAAGEVMQQSKDDITRVIHAKHFNRIVYEEVYPNIDIEFLVQAGTANSQEEVGFKYNVILKPGADVNAFQLLINGAKQMGITKQGNIKLKANVGSIEERIPLSYELDQEGQIGKKIIAKFIQKGRQLFGLSLAQPISNKTVVVDPLLWSTYFGGNASETSGGVCTDGDGNVYITGQTQTISGFATTGAYQTANNSTNLNGLDGFIAKFTPAGALVWSTFFGGNLDDTPQDITADKDNNIYITGNTQSTSGIATTGAFQTAALGGFDGFLAKFTSAGAIVWSTYMAGIGTDQFVCVTTDLLGNVIASGSTSSTTALTFPGVYQSLNAGSADAIIMKFTSAGAILWATYYGGISSDAAQSIATDNRNCIYIGGTTSSSAGIATTGAAQASKSGGQDAFMAKFDANGAIVFGTYYGGSSLEIFNDISITRDGYIYAGGNTYTSSGFTLLNPYQSTYGGGVSDGLLVKMDTAGVLKWSTYYGGTGTEYIYAVNADTIGNVYILGITNTATGMSTTGSLQPTFGGLNDALFASFSPSGVRTMSTYFGGKQSEIAKKMDIDKFGNIYLQINVGSDTILATPGAYQPYIAGGNDIVLAKYTSYVAPLTINNNTISANQSLCAGDPTSDFIGSTPTGGTGAFTYQWIRSNTGLSGTYLPAPGNNTTKNYTPGLLNANRYFRRVVISGSVYDTSNMVAITFGNKLNSGFTINKSIQCLRGNQFVVTDTTANGAFGRVWDFGNGKTSTNQIDSVSYVAAVGNKYTIRLVTLGGCNDTVSKYVYLTNHPVTKTITGKLNSFIGVSDTFTVPASVGSKYTWIFSKGTGSSTSNSIKIKWTQAGISNVQMVETSGGNCLGDTAALAVSILAVNGLEDYFADDLIHVYPNPNNGLFYLNGLDNFHQNQSLQLQVTNVLGEQVLNQESMAVITDGIDLRNLPNGIYFIAISNGNDLNWKGKFLISK